MCTAAANGNIRMCEFGSLGEGETFKWNFNRKLVQVVAFPWYMLQKRQIQVFDVFLFLSRGRKFVNISWTFLFHFNAPQKKKSREVLLQSRFILFYGLNLFILLMFLFLFYIFLYCVCFPNKNPCIIVSPYASIAGNKKSSHTYFFKPLFMDFFSSLFFLLKSIKREKGWSIKDEREMWERWFF